jgi:hypothetical protein
MEREKELREKYQFVVVQNPQEIITNDKVGQLFSRIINFKKTGYKEEYGEFVLPFDSSDFIATHLLMCEIQPNQDLLPVLGFKSVTLANCDSFRIPFPMLGMLEKKEDPNSEYKSVINDILNQYRTRKVAHKIAYNGSFTVHPDLRRNKNLMKYLWEVGFSMLGNYYVDEEIEHVLAVCATKFKVHEKKQAAGWNYIDGMGAQLSPYLSKSLFEASLVPMELKDVKLKCEKYLYQYKDMWDKKLTFKKDSDEILTQAA